MKTIRLLFSDAMARAIVEARKTVTRRPLLDAHGGIPPSDAVFREIHPSVPAAVFDTRLFGPGVQWSARMPCLPGDLLIGRECWAAIRDDDEEWNESTPHGGRVEYRADHDPPLRKPGGWDYAEPDDAEMVHWRPSIHMPDWAARIRRRVVSVTVERVQDIDEDEAMREGFTRQVQSILEGMPDLAGVGEPCDCGDIDCPLSARMEYAVAWESIYAAKGLGWDANPWVWRIEFGAESVEAGK